MKLAIMQPYLLPYIGYFQLLNAVDHFVAYDDVQFIKEGWIHRNRILSNGSSLTFTVPLVKASHTASICERVIAHEKWIKDRKKLLSTLTQNYRKAPYFEQASDAIETCLLHNSTDLTQFIVHALSICCDYLKINTKISRSSENPIASSLRGQERVISICKNYGADHYINATGGMELYDRPTFNRENITLSFIKTQDLSYPQFKNEFIPWLSIIDVMMFNSPQQIRNYLDMFDLV